jgi:hypothetical protein
VLEPTPALFDFIRLILKYYASPYAQCLIAQETSISYAKPHELATPPQKEE